MAKFKNIFGSQINILGVARADGEFFEAMVCPFCGVEHEVEK